MKRLSAKTRILAAAVPVCLLALLYIGPAASGSSQHPTARPAQHKSWHEKHHRKKKPAKQRSTYWGAWIGPQLTGNQPPWDMSAVGRFIELAAKAPSLLEFAAPFADCSSSPCSFYAFPRYEMETIRSFGAIPFFSWGAQSTPVPTDLNLPDFQLSDIANGTYDSYIREFAEGAREWAQPFFLRFDWEMNSDWFPWSVGANGNQPGEFVLAWQHVHDIFTQVGAANATWVWCPYAYAEKPSFGALASFYPGDSYVDWTCLDGYNWARNRVNSQPWHTFDQIFGHAYRTIVDKIAPTKPMVLAEMASGGGPQAKSAWLKDMFKQLRTNYRRIRALIWFEQIDRGVQWPIESSGAATKAFRRGIRQSGFQPNSYPTLSGAPIPPPE
jgi:mannan endo-1,4-beta-mannosidase